MHSRLPFGRRKHEDQGQPSKLMKVSRPAGRDDGEKICRAAACTYSAVMEASRFRAEAGARRGKSKQKGARGWASSDCNNSSLYDSFELDCFSHKLGHCLAEERLPPDVAHRCQSNVSATWQQQSDMSHSSRRQQRAHVVPRWHSRRHSGSITCYPFTFPSCFPKRTPTIQLGKRKPSLNGALHVIAKVARRGCHVIAMLPACTTRGGDVQQPQKQPQAHHHYHHHVHHYSLEGLRGAREHDEEEEQNENLHRVASQVLSPHLHGDEPPLHLSPHTLAYIPLKEMDHHVTSIKYHS